MCGRVQQRLSYVVVCGIALCYVLGRMLAVWGFFFRTPLSKSVVEIRFDGIKLIRICQEREGFKQPSTEKARGSNQTALTKFLKHVSEKGMAAF